MNIIKKEVKHLVSFLEKWTELDVMYYLGGGAWLFFSQFLIIISSFLLSVIFARVTSQETFGQFQFVLAVLGTFGVLTLPGANTAVLLGTSQGKDGTLLQGIRLKIKWSIIGIVGLLATSAYFYFQHEPRYAVIWPIFLIAIVFFPILYSLDVTHAFFTGKKKFSWNCAFQIVTEVGSMVATSIMLFFTRNLLIVISTYLFFQAIGDLLAFRFAKTKIKNKKEDPDFLSYSTHLSVINFIPAIRTYFDKLVVAYFLGFAATAVYAIGAAMAEQLYAVSKNVSNVVFPKLALFKKEKIYLEVKKRTGKLSLFFILVAVAATLLAPVIIPFFFSEQYKSAVPIAQLLLLINIPRAVAFVLTRVQEAQRQKKKLYKINTLYATVEIISILAFTPYFGLYGVVVAKGISNITYFTLAWKSLA